MNDRISNHSDNRRDDTLRGVSGSDNYRAPQAIEYHKGEPCPHMNVLCQEGYCIRCILKR